MLRRRKVLALLAAAGAMPVAAQDGLTPDQLRTTLEGLYVRWLQAMRQSDVAAFATHTSRYRQVCLRNEVISLKQPWPMAVFKNIIRAPSLTGLKFLDASATGDTARLVYFGRVDFDLGSSAPENPLVLRFLQDYGQWRFDWLQYVNLGADDEARRKIAAGDKAWLEEGEFRLTGKRPEPPRPCREPYVIAGISVEARNCGVTVEINGVHTTTVQNNATTGIITGGLQKGANPVIITPDTTTATSAKEPAEISLTVFIRTAPAAKPVPFWSWKTEATPWPARYDRSIFVKSLNLR